MAKAQPKNPRNTPADELGAGSSATAAQAQGQEQDNTAQGTNNAEAAAGAAAEGEAKAQADDSTAAADAVAVAAGASAALAQVASALADADSEAAKAYASMAAMDNTLALTARQDPARDDEGRLEYEVVSPLNNGKRHEIGARVWLSDEDAGPLLGHTVTPYKPAITTDEDEGAAHV